MINILIFSMGFILGGVCTLILFSFAVTPPRKDEEVSNEEIEKELDDINMKLEEAISDLKIKDDGRYQDQPIIILVRLILKDALNHKATEISLVPTENEVITNYIASGVYERQIGPPKRLYTALLARFKLIAGLNLSEHNKIQTKTIQVLLNHYNYDLIISTIPNGNNESIYIQFIKGDKVQSNPYGYDDEVQFKY